MSTAPFSEKVRELIQQSRIVSFATWQGAYPAEVIKCFQVADDEKRYLTDKDCDHIQALVPEKAAALAIAQLLRDQVTPIVDEARGTVLEKFPHITQPGGGLYPAERADACWRDFWHFLRCITYGIAGQRTDYTSAPGLQAMQLLYRELQVPLDAMVVGLEGIKRASLDRLATSTAPVEPYFDHLITQLRQFS
ncbi:MAG: phycobilisome protein [Cyanobacteria bacterium P01_C01_bin.70]